MRQFANFAFAVFFVGPLLAGDGAAAETLRLAGTGGAMPMAERVATGFVVATGIKIEVIPGLGSKGAIAAAADGAIDLAISTRLLTPAEAARDMTAIPFARTALVFITSHPKPNSVNSTALVGIFSSISPKWSDGSPMQIILRTRFDGDSLILDGLFPGMEEAMEAARLRPEIPVAPTDQDNAALAEALPGSFVQAGFSQIVTENRNLRFVPIDGVEPTLENFEAGSYPYEKVFYLVYSANEEAAARRLLAFLRTATGQDILRTTGNVPVVE